MLVPSAVAAQTDAGAKVPASAVPDPTDSSVDPSLADKGKRLYAGTCSRCHGLNMVSTGAGFFDLRTFPANDKPRFFHSVKNGKRAMPAWGDRLQQEDIEALWAYVVTSKPK